MSVENDNYAPGIDDLQRVPAFTRLLAAAEAPVEHFDVVLSHASEDKDTIARPLYHALTAAGVSVWFDEAVLKLGDSLRRKIDEGLARCKYGIVVLSPSFFAKPGPRFFGRSRASSSPLHGS